MAAAKPKTAVANVHPLEVLDPHELIFVTRYIETLDPERSAIEAWPNYKASLKPLRRQRVQEAIKFMLVQKAGAMGITKDVVLTGLLKEARGEFVKLADDGETPISDSTPGSRVTAWRALGEYLQLFTQRIDLNIDGKIKVITGDVIDADKWEEIYTTDTRAA